MMWDYGFGAWWMWIPGLLITLLIVGASIALIVMLVRSTGASARSGAAPTAPSQAEPDPARLILEERLVRGEITPDQFRELSAALSESRQT